MAKIKIIYDRENCIGAAACAAIQPELWFISDKDGKADLIGGKEVKPGFWEKIVDVTDEEKEKFIDAAEACPVRVIKIEEVK